MPIVTHKEVCEQVIGGDSDDEDDGRQINIDKHYLILIFIDYVVVSLADLNEGIFSI